MKLSSPIFYAVQLLFIAPCLILTFISMAQHRKKEGEDKEMGLERPAYADYAEGVTQGRNWVIL